MALGLGDPSRIKYKRKTVTNGQGDSTDNANHHSSNESSNKKLQNDEDYIFPLDEDQMVETPTPATNIPLFGAQIFKNRKSSPIQLTTAPGAIRQRYVRRSIVFIMFSYLFIFFPIVFNQNRTYDRNGVDITPLSFVPGGRVEKYLGNLNFFFIRESTSIRENGGISGFVHGFVTEVSEKCIVMVKKI